MPTAPTKTGCTFAGWYTGIVGSGTEFTESTPVTGDLTVYALWTMSDGEGNVYKTVTIGSQVWIAENLRATKYNDGMTEVPKVTDPDDWEALSSPGYCWYENDSTTYNEDYGILYNWYTMADTNSYRLAPDGWHVPTDAEWNTLEEYLGGPDVAGGKLKEAGITHWSSPNTGATNETGFSVLPGGYRGNSGTFIDIGNYGCWWSATEGSAASSWYRSLDYNYANVYRNGSYKRYGFSVRCVRD